MFLARSPKKAHSKERRRIIPKAAQFLVISGLPTIHSEQSVHRHSPRLAAYCDEKIENLWAPLQRMKKEFATTQSVGFHTRSGLDMPSSC